MRLMTTFLTVLFLCLCNMAQASEALNEKGLATEVSSMKNLVKYGLAGYDTDGASIVIYTGQLWVNDWGSGVRAYGVRYKNGRFDGAMTSPLPKSARQVVRGEYAGAYVDPARNLYFPGIKMITSKKVREKALADIKAINVAQEARVVEARYRSDELQNYILNGPLIPFCDTMKCDKWPVREYLVTEIGKFSEEMAKGQNRDAILIAAMSDKYRFVRQAAARSCITLLDPAFEKPLIKLLDDPDSDVRLIACMALGEHHCVEALAKITTLSKNDPAQPVRFYAFEAIAKIKAKEKK